MSFTMARKSKGDIDTGKSTGERIAKVIARAGLCSRRAAESWIAAGRVAVNGTVIASPAYNVKAKDRIAVDGVPLPQRERTRLFLFHKPRGLVTTSRDPEGRPTVFSRLPDDLPRLISVGRLDLNTEGLLLLTNDGGLARVLERPETGWLRRYRVRARGRIQQVDLDPLRDGMTVDGIRYGAIEAKLDRVQGANLWLTFAIREGKNREVRNVLGALGLTVNRLIRVSYGPFQLGDMASGAVEEVKTRVLADQLGERLIESARVDLDAPIHEREMTPTPTRPMRSRDRKTGTNKDARPSRGVPRAGARRDSRHKSASQAGSHKPSRAQNVGHAKGGAKGVSARPGLPNKQTSIEPPVGHERKRSRRAYDRKSGPRPARPKSPSKDR